MLCFPTNSVLVNNCLARNFCSLKEKKTRQLIVFRKMHYIVFGTQERKHYNLILLDQNLTKNCKIICYNKQSQTGNL